MTLLYRFGWTVSKLVAKLYFRCRIEGKHHIPPNGPTLICANHVSYVDPPLVGSSWPRPIQYLARATLFRGFGAWLYPRLNCIPVDQKNPSSAALKTCIRALKEQKEVIMFPEGARSVNGDLGEAQSGVGLIIAKTKPVVVPVHIEGAHKAFPRGSFFPKPVKITLRFGTPIDYTSRQLESGKQAYQAIATEVMQAIAAAGNVSEKT